MDQFKNDGESHDHSLSTLDLIYQYDSFLDNLTTICDMGCGAGKDAAWWATLETRDDPPEPRNYKVYAVDLVDRIEPEVRDLPNIIPVIDNFENRIIPVGIDLIWCHDAFQYVLDPMNTLKNWNLQMNINGMLMMTIPLTATVVYNRSNIRTYDHMYFCHTLPTIIYMLAVNGFDCKDAYFCKKPDDNWLHVAVYKSTEPLDPRKTRLYDLAEKDLLHPSAVKSLTAHGFLRQEDLIYPWLDKDFHRFIR